MADTVLTQILEEPPVKKREILRYAGAPIDMAEFDDLIDECIKLMLPGLSYKVCYRKFPVTFKTQENGSVLIDLGFTKTLSPSLLLNLKGCKEIILFAGTIGLYPDRLIERYGRLSPSKALFFQAFGAERIEALCDAFMDKIRLELNESEKLRPRFSPGYGGFELSVQKDIFGVLDPPTKIGVTLNDSLLMSPSKSVTALIGIERTPADLERSI